MNDEKTTFGTSGLLYRSNKVMYDRATNTLWSQLTGEPVVGELVGSGIELEIIPIALTTWGEWLAEHPNTSVLSLETGYYSPSQYQREDDSESIYFDYRATPNTMFPVWNRDDRLDTKTEVLGVSVDDIHKAYALSDLQGLRLLHDEVDGLNVVIIAAANSMNARVYESDGIEFTLPDDAPDSLPDTLIDSNGVAWIVNEDALLNSQDSSHTLPRRIANISFWFGWFTFHPDTLLFGDK